MKKDLKNGREWDEKERQVAIERERALKAVDEATAEARKEPTAALSSKAFVKRMRRYLAV